MGASASSRVETPTSVERASEIPAPRRPAAASRPTPIGTLAIEPSAAAPAAGRSSTASRGAVPVADLNAVAGVWDDMVASIRRERPFVATLLEQALPVGTSASGALALQVEAPAVQEAIAAKTVEALAAMTPWLAGLQKITVRLAGDSLGGAPAPRMTVETVRLETLAALRRRDPLLGAAIEELDLDLVD